MEIIEKEKFYINVNKIHKVRQKNKTLCIIVILSISYVNQTSVEINFSLV